MAELNCSEFVSSLGLKRALTLPANCRAKRTSPDLDLCQGCAAFCELQLWPIVGGHESRSCIMQKSDYLDYDPLALAVLFLAMAMVGLLLYS